MDERHKDLSKHRFQQAQRSLTSAKLLINAGDFEGAANRTYYAVFHGMRSILALDEKDFSKHSGVISYFRREYIKTGKFPVEASVIIGEAFNIRSDSDYDDEYDIAEEEIKELAGSVEKLLDWFEEYLNSYW